MAFKEELILNHKYNTELYHHGVKGMKWGVRRYQNYDGSYTQKGLKNYRESAEKYAQAKENYKSTKKDYKSGSTDKLSLNKSKSEMKQARRHANADYRQLARDKRGDKGKRLYQNGKTITGNASKLQNAGIIAAGAASANRYLNAIGKTDAAKYALYTAAGLEVVNGLFAAKNAVEARNLRAYYGHNRNYRKW